MSDDALGFIASAAERSLGARRLIESFLDTGAVWFDVEVDSAVASVAGQDILVFKPTERLLDLISAIRAVDAEGNTVSDAVAPSHETVS